MKYFDNLPKILITDENKTTRLFTNILARASVIPEFLKNPALYYKYDVQDGDTPEIIAHKYYGDSYRYWIVLFANELLDPQWNWPLSNNIFEEYVINKYAPEDVYATVHHYEKKITTIDSETNTITEEKVTIDADTFNSLGVYENVYTLPSGNEVSFSLTKYSVSLYDYELNLNESKRNIQILNSAYVGQIENEFEKLMSV